MKVYGSIKWPVMATSAKACHTKGCKKYTCFYHIFGKLKVNERKRRSIIMEVLSEPLEATRKASCHTKGCKKYTCFYHIIGK